MSTINEIIPSSYRAYSNKNNSKQQKKVSRAEEKDDNSTVAVLLPDNDSDNDNEVDNEVDNKIEPFNEEKFWRIIDTLSWKNSDEKKMTKNDIKRELSSEEIEYLKKYMPDMATHVEESTRPLGWYSSVDENTVKNYTYHVVALGYQYYLSSSIDPTFIQYIWDSNPKIYQDLYSMLISI